MYIFIISIIIIISITFALPFLPAGFPLGFPNGKGLVWRMERVVRGSGARWRSWFQGYEFQVLVFPLSLYHQLNTNAPCSTISGYSPSMHKSHTLTANHSNSLGTGFLIAGFIAKTRNILPSTHLNDAVYLSKSFESNGPIRLQNRQGLHLVSICWTYIYYYSEFRPFRS